MKGMPCHQETHINSTPFAEHYVHLHLSLVSGDSAPTGMGNEPCPGIDAEQGTQAWPFPTRGFSIDVHREPCRTCGGLLCSEGTETGLPSSTLPPGTDAPEKACFSAGSA